MQRQIIKILCLFILLTGVGITNAQYESWEVIGEMPVPVSGGQAVVYDSKIYIIGGFSDSLSENTGQIQVFDPENLTWQTQGNMQTPRSRFITDVFNDNLFICGGIVGDSAKNKSIEMWDFEAVPSHYDDQIFMNRINVTGGIFDNSLYLFGGYSDPGFAPYVLPYIVQYNIPEKSVVWTESNLFQDTMPYQQLSAQHESDFYIFGGVIQGISNKVYKFDTQARTLERIYPNLLQPRAGGQAVKDDHNTVYLLGGYNESQGALASVETYTINSYGYTNESVSSLNTARKELMAVYYNNQIYVFGGKDEFDRVVPTIEIVHVGAATGVQQDEATPVFSFQLYNNYPNPFNSSTVIRFELPENSSVRLDIYSTTGQHVKTLCNRIYTPGSWQLQWDGLDQDQQTVASGVYIYKLTTDYGSESKKMLFVK